MTGLWEIYKAQFKTSLAVSVQYRANMTIWIISLINEPIIYMAVWTTVARAQGGVVGGITTGDFAAYYITWMLVRHFSVTLAPEALEFRVRNGEYSGLLLRPVHPVHVDIADNLGYKLVALPIVIVMMIGLAIFFPPTFTPQLWAVLAFIPVMGAAFLIRFLSHWILGMIPFWATRARAIFEIFYVAEIFLTGRLAPLSLLPGWVQVLASVLPFRWMISFPVELFLGNVSPQEALLAFGAQIIWLTLMIALLRFAWRAAVRRYSAVGA
jgi:ABC-2 type transport system permease protein